MHFGCHSLGSVAAGIQWVESRDAAHSLQCPGQTPTTKNNPAPKAKIENLALETQDWVKHSLCPLGAHILAGDTMPPITKGSKCSALMLAPAS